MTTKTIDYEMFDDEVDRFLRHQMTMEEEVAFKNKLENNTDLKHRAATIALTIHEMRRLQQQEDAKVISAIKGMSKNQFMKTIGAKRKFPKLKVWRAFIRFGVAACIAALVVVGGYRYMIYRNTIALGNGAYYSYIADISDSEYVRGTTNSEVVNTLLPLFENVENGNDLSSTILTLSNLYKKALCEDSEYNFYLDDIAWNLAIAYLKEGDREKPISLLEGMIERNRAYPEITNPAQHLIDNIKDL